MLHPTHAWNLSGIFSGISLESSSSTSTLALHTLPELPPWFLSLNLPIYKMGSLDLEGLPSLSLWSSDLIHFLPVWHWIRLFTCLGLHFFTYKIGGWTR